MATKQAAGKSSKLRDAVFEVLDAVPPNASWGPYKTAEMLVTTCKTYFDGLTGDDLIDHVNAWFEKNRWTGPDYTQF